MPPKSAPGTAGGVGSIGKAQVIKKCEELIRSFNPVTHSIDTHCLQHLGDTSAADAKPDNVFIQQIVYGWFRERPALDAFIKNFYADMAACVARVDITLYTIFAYMAIFRLDEMGFPRFMEYVNSQDPTKMQTFISYLFNKEVLWSSLRADWMKVLDLSYVEDDIIAGIERFIPDASKFTAALLDKAQGLAAAQAAKEEAKNNGTAGLGTVEKKALTRPVSPKLNRPRPPRLPEPECIPTQIRAEDVPSWLDRTSLDAINTEAKTRREKLRQETKSKYTEKTLFTFNETKFGRKKEDLLRELEDVETKDLAFDSSFVNPAPDFKKMPAKVRLNASTILREDALYRKQQAKDAAMLQNYVEELRDPVEYFTWQAEMKENDAEVKLKQVQLRRDQAKQSAEEAHAAVIKQKEDNRIVAKLIREQAEAIKQQKALEQEIAVLKNQEVAKSIIEVRETAPKIAVEKVLVERIAIGKSVREELEQARLAKIEEDKAEEERRADKIRQLKAVNTVHRQHIVVFDPTKTAGIGLLDEMSYMEMKERLRTEKLRAEAAEASKRQEILDAKQKKAKELEERALSVLRARQVKAEATKAFVNKKKEAELKEAEALEKKRQAAAVKLEAELQKRREEKKIEAENLLAEQERVRRQQQYLGAAAGLVEETRNTEILMAKERKIRNAQRIVQENAALDLAVTIKDKASKLLVQKQEAAQRQEIELEREKNVAMDRRMRIETIKAEITHKKAVAKQVYAQNLVTKQVLKNHNPYAENISQESIRKARRLRERGALGGERGSRSRSPTTRQGGLGLSGSDGLTKDQRGSQVSFAM